MFCIDCFTLFYRLFNSFVHFSINAFIQKYTKITLLSVLGAEVKLGLGKRIWHGFKSVLLRDHHEGLRMQRGVGYATFGGRGAGAWPWMAEGGGERIGNDGGRTVGRMRKDDKRAIFMMGA